MALAMLAAAFALLLGVCDLGVWFAEKSAWTESAVDFTVDHASDGFAFASQKRDIVNCLQRGGSAWKGLPAYESRIYYGQSGAERVEISLYNRGDSGEAMDEAALKTLLQKIAAKAEPGGRLGRPERRKLRNGGFAYACTWPKADPVVELAWGISCDGADGRSADYVRVTLTPRRAEKPKGAVKSVSGQAARAKVRANVTKNPEGDVWIRNVPMVDQGRKGYCSVATAERVLRYYGNAVDEHELAQMAGSSAKTGTSLSEMIDTVKVVGSKCRLGFSEIVLMAGSLRDVEKEIENYNKAAKAEKADPIRLDDFTEGGMVHVGAMRAAMRPKVVKRMRIKDSRYKKFLSGVRSQVAEGIPVFWGVTLGMFPEPGLPQTAGGHIRLIIGYNEKTGEILYSDSWGAGHELKRMPEDWAFAITHSAFFLKPL